jgi:hypothetical protein
MFTEEPDDEGVNIHYHIMKLGKLLTVIHKQMFYLK